MAIKAKPAKAGAGRKVAAADLQAAGPLHGRVGGKSKSTKTVRAKSRVTPQAAVKKLPEPSAIGDEALAAWHRDRLDPDNYLVIPEFGVMPAAVAFKGFEFPIVTPRTQDDSFIVTLRDMVRTARRLARAKFTSLGALRKCHIDALDAGFPYDNPALDLTEEQAAATRYVVAMWCFTRADSGWRDERCVDHIRRTSMSSYATGASLIVGWLEGRPLRRDLEVLARQRHGLNKGNERSVATRSARAFARHLDAIMEKRDALIAGGMSARDVAGSIAQNRLLNPDNRSVGYIRKLIAKGKKKRDSS